MEPTPTGPAHLNTEEHSWLTHFIAAGRWWW
jgi:hypothetical protein